MKWIQAILLVPVGLIGLPLVLILIGNVVLRPIDWLFGGWVSRNFITGTGQGRFAEFALFGLWGMLLSMFAVLFVVLVFMGHELLSEPSR